MQRRCERALVERLSLTEVVSVPDVRVPGLDSTPEGSAEQADCLP